MKEKIIFLDFDGVITSKEDGSSYLCYNPETYRPSENLLKLLKDFVEETKSKIVISSSWRKYDEDGYYEFKGQKYFNFMKQVKDYFGDTIVGMIPYVKGLRKAECINIWLKDNNYNGNYVIFDDWGSIEGFYNYEHLNVHFVETNETTGLTTKNLIKAKRILETDYEI